RDDDVAGGGGVDFAAGGRNRNHEHHAGVGDLAHTRDRNPHGDRRAPHPHHAAVPGGGDDALVDGRLRGDNPGHTRVEADFSAGAMADAGLAGSGGGRFCLFGGGGSFLWLLPGAQSEPATPDRRSALRIVQERMLMLLYLAVAPANASVKPGDVITPANAAQVKDLVSPGVFY